MNKKVMVGLITLLWLVSCTNATVSVSPTSFDIHLNEGQTKVVNLTFANPANSTVAVTLIYVTGGNIVDWIDLPSPTFTINANNENVSSSDSTYFFTINPDDVGTRDGTLYLNAPGVSPTSFSISITVSEPAPNVSNSTLSVSLLNPPITAKKRMLLSVTDSNHNPITTSGARLTIFSSSDAFTEIPVSNGLATYSAPDIIECPVYGIPTISGYPMNYFFFTEAENKCKATSGSSTDAGKLEFKPSGVTTTVQQGITYEEGYWLKNSLDCPVTIISGEFTSGTTLTPDGRKPVRIRNLPYETIEPGEKLFVTFTVDTNKVAVGTAYMPVFTVHAEDCNGKDVSAVFKFVLDIVQGISSQNQTTSKLELNIYGTYDVGDTATIVVRAGGERTSGAELRVEYPDDTSYTYQTPTSGEISFPVTVEGEYHFTASKDGYASVTGNMSVGSRDLKFSMNAPGLGETLRITVYAGENNTVKNAKVNIKYPSSVTKTFYTSSVGEVTTLANETGQYTIETAKAGYLSNSATINVDLKSLDIITSETPQLSKTIILTAKSGDSIVPNIFVEITPPGGGTKSTYTASSSGEIQFTPTVSGDYSILANKTGYSTLTKTLTVGAKNIVLTTEGELKMGATFVIYASYENTPLPDVAIQVTKPNAAVQTFTTPSNGKVSITADQTGVYNIKATKSSYTETSTTAEIKKKTMTLTPIYYDTMGATTNAPVCKGGVFAQVDSGISNAVFQLTDPLGVMQQIMVRASTDKRGTYTIKATATDYDEVTTQFTVNCPPQFLIPPKDIPVGGQLYLRYDYVPTSVKLVCMNRPDIMLSTTDGTINATINEAGDCSICAEDVFCTPFKVYSGIDVQSLMLPGAIILLLVGIVFIVRKRGVGSGKRKSLDDIAAEFESTI